MVIHTAVNQLPSLPQVLLRILEAIQSDTADYQHMAEIIRQDAAIATRLIAVANSSYFGRPRHCETIERALLFLGTDAVKTIVITAAIKQFFTHFNQRQNHFLKGFWRRSLISANFAQVLATLTSYPSPDEAYLTGLIIDVGQLILLTGDEQPYLTLLESAHNDRQLLEAELRQYQKTHCQLSGELVDSWNLSGFMADAVRYHHEPVDLVQDAQHLVKIINLSSLLSAERDLNDEVLAAADALFGLNEALTRELFSRISGDVDQLASSLGIDIDGDDAEVQEQARQQMGRRLGELGELAQINTSLLQARNRDALQSAIQRSLYLTFGISQCVLFLRDPDSDMLISQSTRKGNLADFRVPANTARSVVSEAFSRQQMLTTEQAQQPLSVIDRQLCDYCEGDILHCWPLPPEEGPAIGVLVFARNAAEQASLDTRTGLAHALCREIATAINSNADVLDGLNQQDPSSMHYQSRIREVVHEASNPLSIIRNYLEMLKIKLGEQHEAAEGLGLIREEIDRVGNILLRLRDPSLGNAGDTSYNINTVVESVATIFRDSICTTHNITLTLKLDQAMNDIEGNPDHLKQILTNLIKNAVEALEQGGEITITSDATVGTNSGANFVAINISDNGPGLPESVKRHLFEPVASTKNGGHSGLGLSIVKKLIDDMEGSIVCRSSAETGTEFQILIPK